MIMEYCDNCSTAVTDDFYRVFSVEEDNGEGYLPRCQECSDKDFGIIEDIVDTLEG